MVHEEVISGLALARDILETSDFSVVVIKNSQVICKKKGGGIKPMMEAIGELGDRIHGSIIGDRILGKASSLLCIYSNAKAVYSPQATKTAIALMLINGIPSQADVLIPRIDNRDKTGMCPFEKMLEDITDPKKAYNILKEKLYGQAKIRREEQAVLDPLSGQNITGDFAAEYKEEMQKKLEDIFSKAEESKSDKNKSYEDYSNEIKTVVHKYYNSLKLPVDEEFVKQNLEKLSKILGIKNDR